MAAEDPRTHLGIAVAAVAFGGTAMLLLFSQGLIGYLLMLPWLLGAIGLYYAVRAQLLSGAEREEIEDRGRRALHFSIFSLSISAIFVVIAVMAHWFASSGL